MEYYFIQCPIAPYYCSKSFQLPPNGSWLSHNCTPKPNTAERAGEWLWKCPTNFDQDVAIKLLVPLTLSLPSSKSTPGLRLTMVPWFCIVNHGQPWLTMMWPWWLTMVQVQVPDHGTLPTMVKLELPKKLTQAAVLCLNAVQWSACYVSKKLFLMFKCQVMSIMKSEV